MAVVGMCKGMVTEQEHRVAVPDAINFLHDLFLICLHPDHEKTGFYTQFLNCPVTIHGAILRAIIKRKINVSFGAVVGYWLSGQAIAAFLL